MKRKFAFSLLFLLQAWTVQATEPTWEHILEAIKDQRATIKTGQFTGIGIAEAVVEDGKPRVKGVMKIRVAFDYPNQKIRFEREAPAFESPDYNARRGGIFIETSETTLRKDLGDKTVFVGKPGDLSSVYLSPFDVRTLGLAFYPDYTRGTSLEEILQNYAKFTDNQLAAVDHGLVSVVTQMPSNLTRTLLVDTKRGYWPISLVAKRRARGSKEEISPQVLSEVELKQIDGVWLPVNYSVASPSRKESFKLKWNTVNKRLDPALFTKESLESAE